jgi:hypothetical protein
MRTTRTKPAGPDPAEAVAAEAVATLYQLHYPSLVRLAALLVPDPAIAEDIVQEAFAALHGEWPALPGTDAALARLRRSVSAGPGRRPRSGPPRGPAFPARRSCRRCGPSPPASARSSSCVTSPTCPRARSPRRPGSARPRCGTTLSARCHRSRPGSGRRSRGRSSRRVADVDDHPVWAGQGEDVIAAPGGQAEAEAQVALEVARGADRLQLRVVRGEDAPDRGRIDP